MCGNIKKLRFIDRPATDEELIKAATQFVKKVSHYSKPSAANAQSYQEAIDQISARLRTMLGKMAAV